MSAEYSVEEALTMIDRIAIAYGSQELEDARAVLAKRIKADESAVPVGHFIQTSPGEWDQAAKEFIGDPEVVPLFTHPPAQAAQVDAMPEIRAWLADYADELDEQGFTDVAATIRTTAASIGASPTAEPAAQGEAVFPMTERQLIEWINACNHEPCRQVLRDYLRLRATQPHSPDAADSGRVTKAMVRAATDAANHVGAFSCTGRIREVAMHAALEAALAAQGQGECPVCHGAGKCNDAEPGDIGYREWRCTSCNGSGKANTAPAASPAGVPDGWRLVPIEPNESMRAAALTTDMPSIGEPPLYEKIWRRMLAAAPSPGESS